MSPIRVLIVEDSAVIREFLSHLFTCEPGIEVAGTASNGAEAVAAVQSLHPSVITMDINMPVMDGLEATRRIMEISPTPIVVVSGNTITDEVSITFLAIEAGALQVVLRPAFRDFSRNGAAVKELVSAVRLMSEIKVVHRNYPLKPGPYLPVPDRGKLRSRDSEIQIVAIGASTGGPLVLRDILGRLPRNYPLPVLIVQHIARGFVQGFAAWLSEASGFPVRIAAQGEPVLPGRAYLAPDDHHLGVSADLRICLSQEAPPSNGLRPSVSHLFRSVARAFGPKAAGVLLTGMGRDGAEELKAMLDMGALTIAQDEASSVVHGMPGEAIKLHGAAYILPPGEIAGMLSSLPENREEVAP